ncbi:hypothetical protein NBRC10512_002543 [Rhodotorula toruloides]|uniref:RHTO0S03e07294g1_1 n=2 Tax=Rhodotorula toruloides TaxID=5286 RepID=A0A061AU67_RHOTO|nr:CRAL/TRIO domain-containing protein [Rhodotorula toruloides NP11]EMS25929.1 CRAL/TRIO domain-containing protein [Rhodotorula toruloides NP11]KAJ8295892.1 CRAL-TRIO domain-containing protein C23B6.04c [Rhodotorula toruloides]CDR38273.1 RHTO0S03e07294g1_1 [Rhodotorula toruloides]
MTAFEDSLPSPPGNPDTPFSYPLAHPDPASKPVAPKELSADQQAKLDRLVDHFNRPDYTLPRTLRALKARWAKEQGGGGSRFGSLFSRSATPTNDEMEDLHPLSDVEKCYWSRQAFSRCLRAVKWDYAAGVRRAEETCVWRREYGVEEMKEEDVSHEGETGKELVMGYDINCRPVLYMHPNRQNTETSPKQIAFVVWCLERTIDLAPATDPATEMLCLCIDFGANQKDAKSQPTTLSQARKVLEILQTYYCERLGRAVCVNIPQIFFAFYKLVSPFVDPVTKEKIRFLDKADATALIPASQLQKIFGGDINMEYDHKTYFPALTKLCMERKAANLERWRKYGEGKCGLDEAIIRGARVPGQQANGTKEVATQKADVDAAPAAAPAAATNGTDDAHGVTPLSEEFAAAALDDPATPAMTTGSDSSEGTAVSPSAGDANPGPDKFVEAPLASPTAVERAHEALHP